jgi:nitroreductase
MSQKAATTAAELIVIVANRSAWRAHANWMLDILKTPVANARPKPPAAADPTAYYSKLIPFLYTHDRLGILGGFKQAVAWFMGLSRPMYRQMSRSDIRITVHKSAALAAQTLMLALQSEGLNTCPMEGFDSVRVKRLLGLGGNREINMILGVGIGKPEGVYGPRLRVPESEVIFER